MEPANRAGPRPILLVEDDEANARLVEVVLSKRSSIRLHTARNGSEALELVSSVEPALILLDLSLPDMSGTEVLRRLKERPETRDTPVLILSGDAGPQQHQLLMLMGVADYITKPYSIVEFLRKIDDALLKVDP